MAYRAGVVGASGYTGAELLRILHAHPEIEVVHATANTNAGAAVADIYPSLGVAYPELRYDTFAAADFAGLDVIFCGLPHGESQAVIPELVGTVGHVVDLGADFRLPAAAYEQWYGAVHRTPELLDEFAFGLPELYRAEINGHAHVASPGCYPTASVLALAPLLADGLVEPTGIHVDAISGVSGAGRGLSLRTHFGEIDESVEAYGLLSHRHTAEMEMVLSKVSGAAVEVLFTPHLAPMTRGLLATAYAKPTAPGLSSDGLLERYRAFYADEPFVAVVEAPPATKATRGSNTAHVTVRFDERTGTVVALGAIDNLVKGASGQAVQATNLLLGLPEGTGLSVVGMYP